MIYKVNCFGSNETYFVSQEIFDANLNYKFGKLIVGNQVDAQELLLKNQVNALEQEKQRFSICATFVDGNNTTWRNLLDSDPEETVCQVFDSITGKYIECANKTEAYALNESKKQEFLVFAGLNSVIELDKLPNTLAQPVSEGTQTL